MHSMPGGSDGNVDINCGVSQKPLLSCLIPPPLGDREGEVGSMGYCCFTVPGPTRHNGFGCGCPEGPAPICSPASYSLPGHLPEPPPWPSHFPAGPQTRGETPAQSLCPLPLLMPVLLRWLKLRNVMGSDWGIGSKKWEEGRAKKKCIRRDFEGCGVGVGHWTLISSFLFPPQCELSALEGMKACMTYFPRACGSLKVSIHGHSSSHQLKSCSCLTSDAFAETCKNLPFDFSIIDLYRFNYTTSSHFTGLSHLIITDEDMEINLPEISRDGKRDLMLKPGS